MDNKKDDKSIMDNLNADVFFKDSENESFSRELGKSISSMNNKQKNTRNYNQNKTKGTAIFDETQPQKEIIEDDTIDETHCTTFIKYEDAAKKRTHNSAMSVVTVCVVSLFMIMIIYIGYFIVFDSKEVINSTYNKRASLLEESILRGTIYSNDDKVLAETIDDGSGNSKRYYPYAELFANVVGRFDNGKTGIESKYDFTLLSTNENELEVMINEFQNDKAQGNSIKTTLDIELQQLAFELLGERKGAIVAIEPATGKILAMVSTPSYDPNYISVNWEKYTEDENEDHVLLNRASQGLYAPGSTFKIITAIEYIRENPSDYKDYKFDCSGSVTFDDYVLHCYNENKHGNEDIYNAFSVSCNSFFATIGSSLSLPKLNDTCKKLLFNNDIPFEFEYNKSSFYLDKNSSDKLIAQSVIGQGEVLMTPLHNAMITAAIANDGKLMETYIVDEILDDDSSIATKTKSKEYKQLFTKEESEIMNELMEGVVKTGTAKELSDLSYSVAGKTGTAEYNHGENAHAWFTGYAPSDNPKIAISIIVEDGGSGSKTAVPIAKKIFDKYIVD